MGDFTHTIYNIFNVLSIAGKIIKQAVGA